MLRALFGGSERGKNDAEPVGDGDAGFDRDDCASWRGRVPGLYVCTLFGVLVVWVIVVVVVWKLVRSFMVLRWSRENRGIILGKRVRVRDQGTATAFLIAQFVATDNRLQPPAPTRSYPIRP